MSNALSELETAIIRSDKLSEEEKLNAIADIGTIHNQLSKPSPERSIIKDAWFGIERAVTIASFTELLQKIGGLISTILGS